MEINKTRIIGERKKTSGRIADIPEMDGKYYLLSPDVYMIERQKNLEKETHNIDIFGPGWLFFRARCKTGFVSILQDEKKVKLGNKIMGYVPSASVIEWILPQGEIEFEMLVSGTPLGEGAPNQPLGCTYEGEGGDLFDCVEDFFDESNNRTTFSLTRTTNPSQLSIHVQDWIHKNWQNKFKLYDLAQELKTCPSVLSRYFKKSFGMSPKKYVNQMRIVSSVKDLLKSQYPIAQISYEMGYSDPRQFNEHFRKIYPVTPFAFKQHKA